MVSYRLNNNYSCHSKSRLNPCCSGRWSRALRRCLFLAKSPCLNPCCSGRWSRTSVELTTRQMTRVLILVVVEDGLVPYHTRLTKIKVGVLILVVVEDGLVLVLSWAKPLPLQVLILVVVEDGLVLMAALNGKATGLKLS